MVCQFVYGLCLQRLKAKGAEVELLSGNGLLWRQQLELGKKVIILESFKY